MALAIPRPMRVLVVDESAERAELLREALLHAGYEVTASLSSPLALLEAIEQARPDVIVIDARGIKAILEAAAQAIQKLAERKLVERAKGLLMKTRNLDEETAYAALRKTAMDRNLKLVEVAQRIVDAADLLGDSRTELRP
jgi:two-component system, response regulator / RNA-binding antiterminator